ncbi:hypothetical protein ABBQ32_008662 [Trebouxia sp. C0010 RCD-2024]
MVGGGPWGSGSAEGVEWYFGSPCGGLGDEGVMGTRVTGGMFRGVLRHMITGGSQKGNQGGDQLPRGADDHKLGMEIGQTTPTGGPWGFQGAVTGAGCSTRG